MPRNIYIVNKNRRPPVGGGPPGDFGKNLTASITPAGSLVNVLGGPPPPQNFVKQLTGRIQPSAVLTRTLIAPPSGAFSRIPSNWIATPDGITEHDMASLSKVGWNTFFNAGVQNRSPRLSSPNAQMTISPPTCAEQIWPVGADQNWGSGQVSKAGVSAANWRKIAIGYELAIPANYYQHPATLTKLGFSGFSGASNQIIPAIQGGEGLTSTLRMAVWLQALGRNHLTARNLFNNINEPAARIVRGGPPIQFLVLLYMANPVWSPTSIIEWYVNNVLCARFTDVLLGADGTGSVPNDETAGNNKWKSATWHMIWGGVNAVVPAGADVRTIVGHMRVRGLA